MFLLRVASRASATTCETQDEQKDKTSAASSAMSRKAILPLEMGEKLLNI